MKQVDEKYLATGYIKRLHVDRHKLRHHDPDPITIQTSGGPFKATGVRVHGPSSFVYRPDDPISCGAILWVETTAEVTILGVMSGV